MHMQNMHNMMRVKKITATLLFERSFIFILLIDIRQLIYKPVQNVSLLYKVLLRTLHSAWCHTAGYSFTLHYAHVTSRYSLTSLHLTTFDT